MRGWWGVEFNGEMFVPVKLRYNVTGPFMGWVGLKSSRRPIMNAQGKPYRTESGAQKNADFRNRELREGAVVVHGDI